MGLDSICLLTYLNKSCTITRSLCLVRMEVSKQMELVPLSTHIHSSVHASTEQPMHAVLNVLVFAYRLAKSEIMLSSCCTAGTT